MHRIVLTPALIHRIMHHSSKKVELKFKIVCLNL